MRANKLHPFSTARRESVVHLSCTRLAIGSLSTIDASLMASAADDEGIEVIKFTNAAHKEGRHACGSLRICPGRFIPPQITQDPTLAVEMRYQAHRPHRLEPSIPLTCRYVGLTGMFVLRCMYAEKRCHGCVLLTSTQQCRRVSERRAPLAPQPQDWI
jgi:hypothetical protein